MTQPIPVNPRKPLPCECILQDMPARRNRFGILTTPLFLAVALAAGCASLPEDYPRPTSTALDDYRSTSLGAQFAASEDSNPGKSGFAMVRYGNNAFNLRVAMIDLAEKTLDLQVYIWEADETGIILADRLIEAADRGVRVRLLVDDMGFGGTDEGMATMDAHRNIEVRVFNPFAHRNSSALDFIVDFDRVNHRMHNKLVVADNSFAVVGGRNIGDHYFGVNPNTNFRDLDIAAAGPVVREVSSVFDHFWESDVAVPARALVEQPSTEGDLRSRMVKLDERIDRTSYPYALEDDAVKFRQIVSNLGNLLTWAPGGIIWNRPGDMLEGDDEGDMIAALRERVARVNESIIIESAYFVPGDEGVERVRELVGRGIRVRVLTNSLASNDVLAAHAGHATFRKDLVEAGAELYELRPDSAVIKKTWKGRSTAGLHTKALVFDDESLVIGSFNLDPRSASINTEASLYVESPELTVELLAYMEEGVQPENSYRVTLDENGDLVWTTIIDGEEVRYYKDPLSTWAQRFTAGFISILPVHSQL